MCLPSTLTNRKIHLNEKKKAKNSVKAKTHQNNPGDSTETQLRRSSDAARAQVGVSRSENRAVFTGEHEPHSTGILGVDEHPNTHRQPYAVATTTHDFLADRIPAQEDGRG